MKILFASLICAVIAYTSGLPAASSNQDVDIDDLINRLQPWSRYNDEYDMPPVLRRFHRVPMNLYAPPRGIERRAFDMLGEKGPGADTLYRRYVANQAAASKEYPMLTSKKMDPTDRNLLLYSYFNRLGPEKRFNFEDLYEMQKRNFDEIDGSAFSPFKRQQGRH